MVRAFDPQIQEAMLLLAKAEGPLHSRGDWRGLRETVNELLGSMVAKERLYIDVKRVTYAVGTFAGSLIGLRWYHKTCRVQTAAVLYIHGGGMVGGSVDLYDALVASYVDMSSVPMLAVDYRLPPHYQQLIPVEDCYLALEWLVAHATQLHVDCTRIAVMGDSAGGALAAGVALLARERGLCISKQILIYPMLDDRNTTPDPTLTPFATWTYDNNFTGWSALIGDQIGTSEVSSLIVPAREQDFRFLPEAYIEVGDLDIFRDEDLNYARRLSLAGTSVEFHVHPGAPHGFDLFAPNCDLTRRAMADRVRVLKDL